MILNVSTQEGRVDGWTDRRMDGQLTCGWIYLELKNSSSFRSAFPSIGQDETSSVSFPADRRGQRSGAAKEQRTR